MSLCAHVPALRKVVQTLPRVRQAPSSPAHLCLLPFPSSSLTGTLKEGVLPVGVGERLAPAQAAGSQSTASARQVLRDRWPDSAGSPGATQPLSQLRTQQPSRDHAIRHTQQPNEPLTWTASQGHMGRRGEGCVPGAVTCRVTSRPAGHTHPAWRPRPLPPPP